MCVCTCTYALIMTKSWLQGPLKGGVGVGRGQGCAQRAEKALVPSRPHRGPTAGGEDSRAWDATPALLWAGRE